MSEVRFIDWEDLENARRRVLFVVHVWFIVCKENERRESSEIRFGDQLRCLFIVSFYVLNANVIAIVDLLHILLQRVVVVVVVLVIVTSIRICADCELLL